MIELMINQTKVCSICGLLKEISEFHHRKISRDGFAGVCKECRCRHKREVRHNYRDTFLAYAKKHNLELKMKILAHYGEGKIACVVCGESDSRCLSIDHIDGNGGKHRKDLRKHGASNFYQWLKRMNYPVGYQTLCMNCQFKKGGRIIEQLEFWRATLN